MHAICRERLTRQEILNRGGKLGATHRGQSVWTEVETWEVINGNVKIASCVTEADAIKLAETFADCVGNGCEITIRHNKSGLGTIILDHARVNFWRAKLRQLAKK